MVGIICMYTRTHARTQTHMRKPVPLHNAQSRVDFQLFAPNSLTTNAMGWLACSFGSPPWFHMRAAGESDNPLAHTRYARMPPHTGLHTRAHPHTPAHVTPARPDGPFTPLGVLSYQQKKLGKSLTWLFVCPIFAVEVQPQTPLHMAQATYTPTHCPQTGRKFTRAERKAANKAKFAASLASKPAKASKPKRKLSLIHI